MSCWVIKYGKVSLFNVFVFSSNKRRDYRQKERKFPTRKPVRAAFLPAFSSRKGTLQIREEGRNPYKKAKRIKRREEMGRGPQRTEKGKKKIEGKKENMS